MGFDNLEVMQFEVILFSSVMMDIRLTSVI